jgi:multidrug efflux pump subunit AcrB
MRGILAEGFPSIRYKVDRLFLGPPTGWPVQMRVVGPDRAVVRQIADKVSDAFRAEPLLSAVRRLARSVPTMKLVIDQDRARALGVSSSASARSAGEPFRHRSAPSARARRSRSCSASRQRAHAALGGGIDLRADRSRRAVPVSQLAKVVPALEPGIEWRRDRLRQSPCAAFARRVQPNDV